MLTELDVGVLVTIRESSSLSVSRSLSPHKMLTIKIINNDILILTHLNEQSL